jgi:hypothetical protein
VKKLEGYNPRLAARLRALEDGAGAIAHAARELGARLDAHACKALELGHIDARRDAHLLPNATRRSEHRS